MLYTPLSLKYFDVAISSQGDENSGLHSAEVHDYFLGISLVVYNDQCAPRNNSLLQ